MEAALGVHADVEALFLDHSDEDSDKSLIFVGLVHPFDARPDAGLCLGCHLLDFSPFRKPFSLGGVGHHFPAMVPFGDLFEGFPIGRIADEEGCPLQGNPRFSHKGFNNRLVGLKDLVAETLDMEGDGGFDVGESLIVRIALANHHAF